jgi:hypothetical protein
LPSYIYPIRPFQPYCLIPSPLPCLPLYQTILSFSSFSSLVITFPCSSHPSFYTSIFYSSLPLSPSLSLPLLSLVFKLPLDKSPFLHAPRPTTPHPHSHQQRQQQQQQLSHTDTHPLTHIRHLVYYTNWTCEFTTASNCIYLGCRHYVSFVFFCFHGVRGQADLYCTFLSFFLFFFLYITCFLPRSLSARLYRLYWRAVGYSCLIVTVNTHAHTYT